VTGIENSRHVLLIRVRMDDGSSCTFGATAQKDKEMSGGCICFDCGDNRRVGGTCGAPTETVRAKAGSRRSRNAGRWQIIQIHWLFINPAK
jgi:hypothetical protein